MKQRILMNIPRPWDYSWGQEKDLIKQLSDRYDFTVLEHFDYEGLPRTYEEPEAAQVIFRKMEHRPGALFALKAGWMNLRDSLRYDHDIYITYQTFTNTAAMLACRLRGKKVMLIYADDLPGLYKKYSLLGSLLTRYMFNPLAALLSHRIVCTARLLMEDIGSTHKSEWIPNGVDPERLPEEVPFEPVRPYTIGFVGGFGDWADMDLLLDAAARRPDLRFLLIGAGEQYEHVKKRAKGLENVELTGFILKDEVDERMQEIDICTIPFHRNHLTDRVSPIKLFEYWAHGKPVITSHFDEVERTGEGIVEFADDLKEFLEAIDVLLDKKTYAKRVKAGRKEVRNYTWDVLGKKYLKTLKGLEAT